MTQATRFAIDLPVRFMDDRAERALPCGNEDGISQSNPRLRTYYVTREELADIAHDAEHYSDVTQWAGERAYFGLEQSARATAKRARAALAKVQG
jgi:hypothetical protein